MRLDNDWAIAAATSYMLLLTPLAIVGINALALKWLLGVALWKAVLLSAALFLVILAATVLWLERRAAKTKRGSRNYE